MAKKIQTWQIFVKAGKPGWYGIIPYYNTYELAKLAFKDKKWHWITLAAVVVMTMSSWISTMFVASAQSASSVSVQKIGRASCRERVSSPV